MATPSTTSAGSGRSQSRPLGLTIICIVGAIGTLFSMLGSLGVLGSGSSGMALVGLLLLVVGVAKFVVLVGLWTLQRWGYTWGLVSYGLGAVLQLFTVNILGLLVSLLIVGYLASISHVFE